MKLKRMGFNENKKYKLIDPNVDISSYSYKKFSLQEQQYPTNQSSKFMRKNSFDLEDITNSAKQKTYKFFKSFRQNAFKRISENYKSPYVKFLISDKNMNTKPEQLPKYVYYYKVNNFLNGKKNQFYTLVKENDLYYDYKEYIKKYYSHIDSLIILKYLFFFIYNRDVYTTYFKRHHNKSEILENYEELIKSNSNKYYQKKYPHITSIFNIPWNYLPNCIPNYYGNSLNIIIYLEPFMEKIKYRKLKTKKEIQKEIINNNEIKNIIQKKEKNKNDNSETIYKESDNNSSSNENDSSNILDNISFDSIDDGFNNDIEYEEFQVFFNAKIKNRRIKKDKEIKDIINLIKNIPDEKIIKKRTIISDKNINSLSCNKKINLNNIINYNSKSKIFLKNKSENKSRTIDSDLNKEKSSIKNFKSSINNKTNVTNFEKTLFGRKMHNFKTKDKFLKGMKENMKKNIYKKRLFDKINNTYKVLEFFTTRNSENNYKKNNIFPMISNSSNYSKKNTSHRSILITKTDVIRNTIFRNKI